MSDKGLSAEEIRELELAIGWPVADGHEPTEEGREFCQKYGHAPDYSHAESPICARCGENRYY